jgi:hypothetical protein
VIAIHIDPWFRNRAELLSFSAARRCGELLAGHLSTASAETIRFAGPSTVEDRRSECTTDPERHTVADGSDFCSSAPARQFDRSFKALAPADVGKIFPAFCLCRDGFRWPSFFPIPRAVVHTNRANHAATNVAELHVPNSELAASAFQITDRDPLNRVAIDSHVGDGRNVLNEKPFRFTLGDDAACVLQHFAAVLDAVVIGFRAVSIRHRKPLTRRARHDAIDPARDAGELTNVCAGDFVGSLNDYETCDRECTVQKTDAREEGKDELSHAVHT